MISNIKYIFLTSLITIIIKIKKKKIVIKPMISCLDILYFYRNKNMLLLFQKHAAVINKAIINTLRRKYQ